MSTHAPADTVVYPDCDGKPLAENTLQYEWITRVVGGIQTVFRDDPNVFVAGDLFWYPVEGDNKTRTAPDGLVALGRPRGHRKSYMQWREGGVAPQVVFEVLSPGNRAGEMRRKFQFYERFGVEEYYILDPDLVTLQGWLRAGEKLLPIAETNGWTSPRLGIRFELAGDDLRILGPDGQPFVTYVEMAERAEEQSRLAEEQSRRAEEQSRLAEEQSRRAERLAEQLRALGIDPET